MPSTASNSKVQAFLPFRNLLSWLVDPWASRMLSPFSVGRWLKQPAPQAISGFIWVDGAVFATQRSPSYILRHCPPGQQVL